MPSSDRRKPTSTAAILDEAKRLLPESGLASAAGYAIERGIPRFIAYKVLQAPAERQRHASRRKSEVMDSSDSGECDGAAGLPHRGAPVSAMGA